MRLCRNCRTTSSHRRMPSAASRGAPKFTDEQVKAYTTVGGTPFLDNQYTVFGEVEEGLDVVEQIQNVATGRNDRPVDDVVMTLTVI